MSMVNVFPSFVKVYDGESLPSLDLTPGSKPLCLVSSSLSPLCTNIACITAQLSVLFSHFFYLSLIAIFIYFASEPAYVRLPFLFQLASLRLPRLNLPYLSYLHLPNQNFYFWDCLVYLALVCLCETNYSWHHVMFYLPTLNCTSCLIWRQTPLSAWMHIYFYVHIKNNLTLQHVCMLIYAYVVHHSGLYTWSWLAALLHECGYTS